MHTVTVTGDHVRRGDVISVGGILTLWPTYARSADSASCSSSRTATLTSCPGR
ncbi:hypothetical protein ACFQ3Z_25015 [Streptomyces nogalater]